MYEEQLQFLLESVFLRVYSTEDHTPFSETASEGEVRLQLLP